MGRPKEILKGAPKEELKAKVNKDIVIEKVVDPEYKIEVHLDYYGKVDVFHLSNKDQKYAYRFLNSNDKNLSLKTNNMLLQKGGWQIVGSDHLKRIGVQERFISPDGMYRVGDTVLAFMPKELFTKKEEYKRKQANEPMDAIKRLLKKGDPTTGGKEMHKTMKGIQTQEALTM